MELAERGIYTQRHTWDNSCNAALLSDCRTFGNYNNKNVYFSFPILADILENS